MSALLVYAVDTAIVAGLFSASYMGVRLWNKMQALNLESSEVRKAVTELDRSTKEFQSVMREFESARQSLSQFEQKIRENDVLKQEFQELLDVANIRIERLDDQMKSAMSASVLLNETLTKVTTVTKPKRKVAPKPSKAASKIAAAAKEDSKTVANVYKAAVNESPVLSPRTARVVKSSNVVAIEAPSRRRAKA